MPIAPPPCRLHVLLAGRAPVGVVLRRGPARWVEIVRWDLECDSFERGAWFRGRIYEHRCDLSADGRYFVYFAAKPSARSVASDYLGSWTAVSLPPRLTALALWPQGHTWTGGGLFRPDGALELNGVDPAAYHPAHRPPSELRLAAPHGGRMEPGLRDELARARGWSEVDPGRGWRKPSPDGRLELDRYLAETGYHRPGGPYHDRYALVAAGTGEPLADLPASWADWDGRGRLVWVRDGKLFAATPDATGRMDEIELADFNAVRPPVGTWERHGVEG